MDNEKVLKIIEDKGEGVHGETEERFETIKFLVFHINQKNYALYADQIREIVLDIPMFYVPFVPSYITGFINRHGEPYTALDLNMLFEQKRLDSATYLILNSDEDQVAFQISDVVEIMKISEKDIHLITSQDEHEGFFVGSLTSREGSEIFILSIQNILLRLENDIGRD